MAHSPLCPVCGASPCFLICPRVDPYGGDQAAENADYEMGAQYDDRAERYYGEGERDDQWGPWPSDEDPVPESEPPEAAEAPAPVDDSDTPF